VNRQQGRAALLDKSSNGTYINKVRVGKEKSSRLAHLDEIGVLECDFALYYFLDEGLLKLQLAEDLWSKYIVGRSFLAANSTQNYFLIACMLSFL